ncbi:M23 family metallopeptidase [Crocinitomix catalasitica]|uniref:M23 family metallopeptidase n=1 Tax=Crocinitomix catalasitica TaxID=184607 RepID=UPI00055C666D|nr:peptidoglycan DD-metalloendopeptidase family protein [Crocinitomix catalasitica]
MPFNLKVLSAIIICSFSFIIASCGTKSNSQTVQVKQDTVIIIPPVIEYGFTLDSFRVVRDTVQPNWTLSHMLAPYGVSQWDINQAADLAADSTVGLRYVKEGTPYIILSGLKDTSNKVQYCIYPMNLVDYVVFTFTDSIEVEKRSKPNMITEHIMSGEIIKNSNLTFALDQQIKNINMTGEMAEYIAGVFAWTIDFFKLHPGDEFKVIYDEKSVDGLPYSVGGISAAWFNHQGNEFYAFEYMIDSATNKVGYFNEEGKEMKRPFLMAPVQYSRISSGFSGRRFHPVQKRWKAHLGTDYAAPKGTPIMSTADGTVIAAAYTRGNGNYVKVKHNDTYTTQYLHMTGFAAGIKKGTYVKQGQTIGYVGSTGLATGPHVCYRFWKNGKQINHRAEKFPSSVPMVDSLLPHYLEYIAPIKAKLDSMKVTPYIEEPFM